MHAASICIMYKQSKLVRGFAISGVSAVSSLSYSPEFVPSLSQCKSSPWYYSCTGNWSKICLEVSVWSRWKNLFAFENKQTITSNSSYWQVVCFYNFHKLFLTLTYSSEESLLTPWGRLLQCRGKKESKYFGITLFAVQNYSSIWSPAPGVTKITWWGCHQHLLYCNTCWVLSQMGLQFVL